MNDHDCAGTYCTTCYANAAPEPITEAEYMAALELLPPYRWQHARGWERFMMSEFLVGTWTTQYARIGDRYYRKPVDVHDNATWLNPVTLRAVEV